MQLEKLIVDLCLPGRGHGFCIFLIVGMASAAVYLLQASFLSANRMSALKRVKKGIPKTMSMPALANEVYSQNQTFPNLLS